LPINLLLNSLKSEIEQGVMHEEVCRINLRLRRCSKYGRMAGRRLRWFHPPVAGIELRLPVVYGERPRMARWTR
jgi:hypothetical protein